MVWQPSSRKQRTTDHGHTATHPCRVLDSERDSPLRGGPANGPAGQAAAEKLARCLHRRTADPRIPLDDFPYLASANVLNAIIRLRPKELNEGTSTAIVSGLSSRCPGAPDIRCRFPHRDPPRLPGSMVRARIHTVLKRFGVHGSMEDLSAALQPNGSGERDDRRCRWREEGR